MIRVEREMDCGNSLVPFNMPLHGVSVLVGDPARVGGRIRAPESGDTRKPLYDGVPRDMGSGRDYGWIGGGCSYQVTNIGSIWEAGDKESA